jgi:endonuclease G
MPSNQGIARAVRERLAEADVQSQISHSLRCVAEQRPLRAEPDQARRIRRVQAVTGLSARVAEAVADYRDVDTLGLDAGERTGAESIQGSTVDFVGAAFLALGARAARAVARISFRDGQGEGTGFLVSDRLLVTNHHVIGDEAAAAGFMAEFDYELGVDHKPRAVTRFGLDPEAFFVTDDQDDLDYTIVALSQRLAGPAELADLGCCPLSGAGDKHSLGECVNIVQHPDARMKEIVVRENRLVARLPFTLHYLADTEPGSSGSPVFNDQWQVIALHHWGVPHREVALPDGTRLSKNANEGIRISAIVQELEARLSRMSGARRDLLEAALRLGSETRGARQPIVVTGSSRGAGEGPRPEAPTETGGSLPAIGSDGSVTWRIPIDISITLGHGAVPRAATRSRELGHDGPAVSAPATGPARTADSEKARPSPDYRNRSGYDPAFLPGGHIIDLPALSDAQKDVAAQNRQARTGEDPFELKYTHYSVKLHGGRRLAFFSAANIDGATSKNVDRKTGAVSDAPEARGDSEDPEGFEAREPWYLDPRVDDDKETNDTLYVRQTIDGQNPGQLRIFERGHLTRRQDPAWGSEADAVAANADTFHFTNCAPQIGFFNEGKSKREGEAAEGRGESGTLHWRAIEDYVLDNARAQDLRVTVLTGPVLDAENDIPWRDDIVPDFKVPREFWKVVVRVENDELLATALYADQSPLIDRLPEARATGFKDLSKVEKYQVSIAELERKTGLDFGQAIRDADTISPQAEARRRPLSSIAQVSLDKPSPDNGNGPASRARRSGRTTRRRRT